MEDHSGVGQGTVMLDIGGEIGALVIGATEALDGVEIEIRPTGDTPFADPAAWSSAGHPTGDGVAHGHGHSHSHGETRDDGSTHDHDDQHRTDHPHLLHVAVHHRFDGTWSAVFPELHEGTYELYQRPDGPVRLAVEVTGGRVTNAIWPS